MLDTGLGLLLATHSQTQAGKLRPRKVKQVVQGSIVGMILGVCMYLQASVQQDTDTSHCWWGPGPHCGPWWRQCHEKACLAVLGLAQSGMICPLNPSSLHPQPARPLSLATGKNQMGKRAFGGQKSSCSLILFPVGHSKQRRELFTPGSDLQACLMVEAAGRQSWGNCRLGSPWTFIQFTFVH